jgi:hypothetical protein
VSAATRTKISSGWGPITRPPRKPFVVCVECRARELNEHNRLRRAGWQQSGSSWSPVYRCGRHRDDEEPMHVLCADFTGHAFSHRWIGGEWRCTRCEPKP